ncbi:MAG: CRISPR-associated endonuclease Cas1 [Bryobacterales bacterium]|nr:CRISPR-associated endonuclease Cas1 [Bryobacterales bacterium]MBV9396412.1 CRISPR-associated endonuclease Cas1 [Bryobacterales bacterium]
MSALPIVVEQRTSVPDYLPARMVNEFAYCPRLFYYEWVEGLFEESSDTIEGENQHRRVDEKATALPAPADLPESIHARSVTLASERLRVIAKLDLVEAEGGMLTPVDYKHGRPREGSGGLELWPSDRAQLAVQGIVLRDNGYRCEEGIVYYRKTGQRVRVAFDDALIAETEALIRAAWSTAGQGQIPPPLVDSPKCPKCSLVGICLPDETLAVERGASGSTEATAEPAQLGLFDAMPRKPIKREVRPMITPRMDLRPLYLNSQGVRVGKSGLVLQVREDKSVLQEVRMGEICQVNLMGNVQISTQAVQALCEAEVPICYFSMGGWFYGITTGLNQKNVFLRRSQYRLAEQDYFTKSLARRLVAGKARNQRTMIQRNHVEPPRAVLDGLKEMADRAERASSLEELLGIEGNAARLYFGAFGGMIKLDEEREAADFAFDFEGRNRRPPRDPVNAMLSLGYSLLAKDLTVACYAVGFDPYIGYYHQPRFGRPALALDLMEPFRPLIADSAVLTAINTGMVAARDFVRVGGSMALTPGGRKGFFRAYELRMDTLVTHPLFDYRVSYRRLLEIQSRLLARVLEGEIGEYPVFMTR